MAAVVVYSSVALYFLKIISTFNICVPCVRDLL